MNENKETTERQSDEATSSRASRLRLPVLPLRNVVVFPGVTLPIVAGRPQSLRAIESAYAGDEKLLFTLLQQENREEVSLDGLHTVGTIARIDQHQRGLAGTQLLLTGLRRGIALRVEEENGMLMAVVTDAPQLLPGSQEDPAYLALFKELRERAAELGEKSGLPKETIEQVLSSVSDPGRFADFVAGHIELSTDERQHLLELFSVEDRLREVLTNIQRQINVLDAQEDIKSRVQEEIGDRQREIFLREQMKAIQSELGEANEVEELAELTQKLGDLDLPQEVRTEVDRELGRLKRMGREAMEAQVIRTYLETIAELPWSERSGEHLELDEAQEVLDQDHYGLDDVKERVLEFLAVRQLQKRRDAGIEREAREAEQDATSPDTPTVPAGKRAKVEEAPRKQSPILLFVGPPGVGKTSIAKSIARAMGRKYQRISLGGVRDEADIRGHRRTYVAAMPGRIVQGLKQVGTKNPVFLLDEVDKLAASYQGNPASALLEVLDPAQNHTFTDHYLGVPFDLSEVLFIATANFIQNIPAPLLDRMEVVEFSGYTEQEKLEIARQYLVPRQLEAAGLSAEELILTDPGLEWLISRYTREAGVRQLEREIGRLARKAARRIAGGEETSLHLGAEDIKTMLGRPKVHPETAAERDLVGVATGMFYTPVGGDIMFVEASAMPGKGDLRLTGQLGDVMKESAQAAWTYARTHAAELAIPEDGFERDLHIHVPAGAIPKDGPSAGVTMATAIVSALSRRAARHDVAMTGEITLSGRVLPIGGVKEKVLGAVRAGIRHIVLPAENEADLEDLPASVRAQIEVTFAAGLGEVLAQTLRDAELRDGRLIFRSLDSSATGVIGEAN